MSVWDLSKIGEEQTDEDREDGYVNLEIIVSHIFIC